MTRWTLALLALAACGGGEPLCEDAELQCSEDGMYLEECVDGQWAEAENCGEQGLMCHEEMGHCMAMTDTTGTM